VDVSEHCNFQRHSVKEYLRNHEHQKVPKCYKSDFLKWLRNAVLNNILQVHESLPGVSVLFRGPT